MGLDFKGWLMRRLSNGAARAAPGAPEDEVCGQLYMEFYVRELAFWSCVGLISNAIGKCEFKTFHGGRETRQREYYLWNIEPNKNQNSSEFLHKLVSTLYRRNEALVVEQEGGLLVADAFQCEEYALYENRYTGVQVGDFTFQKTFRQPEVLHFRLSEQDMRPIVNGLYDVYRRLLDCGVSGYRRSRGQKGIIMIDTMAAGGDAWRAEYERLKNIEFRRFSDAESALLPLYKGFSYQELGSKTYTSEGTRDIRAMIDDISDFTAKAVGMPPVLLSGKVEGTADALESFLTFCIDPLADMLSEEINRKRYGYAGFSKGDFLRIDTRSIKHLDLLGVSGAIDKLISSGAYCINDIRRLTGDPEIDEPWARQHFMTRNYAAVGELLAPLQA